MKANRRFGETSPSSGVSKPRKEAPRGCFLRACSVNLEEWESTFLLNFDDLPRPRA
jgi:hypothetical protein